ncbi:MAG: HesA/MoeB/ThiF family protein [Planktomarina sp.]
MIVLGILALLIWFGGRQIGWPRALRLGLLTGLYTGIMLMHLVLPDGHALRMATGESIVPWATLLVLIALVVVYRRGLGALKKRTRASEASQPHSSSDSFSSAELNRYARHIILREIGGAGQKQLKNAKVLVIGAGGLGAPALQYLAAAGVGTIGVIDDDEVENANLQRQVIHRDADIGMAKVFSAQAAMQAQNPFVTVKPYHRRLTEEIAEDLFAEYDIVLDGSDNFDTRYLANRTAVALGIPLISGALSQWEGQLSVFDPKTDGPCYQCIFPEAPAEGLAPSCAEAGVFAPLPGVIGSMMAAEAMKLITNAGTALRGELLIYDALYGESRRLKASRSASCPICGTGASS